MCLSSCFNGYAYAFLRETDNFHQTSSCRTFEKNLLLLNNHSQTSMDLTAFNVGYLALVIDSGASSSAATHKSDCVEGIFKILKVVTMLGIA